MAWRAQTDSGGLLTAATASPAFPSGTATGDFVLMTFNLDGNQVANFVDPSSWTVTMDPTQEGTSTIVSLVRQYDGSWRMPTVTLSTGAIAHVYRVDSFSGAASLGLFDSDSGTGTAPTAPGHAVAVGDEVVWIALDTDVDAAPSPPSGFTARGSATATTITVANMTATRAGSPGDLIGSFGSARTWAAIGVALTAPVASGKMLAMVI